MISCVVFCVAIVLEIWDHKTDKILDKVYLHKEKKEEIETESKKEELEDSGCENDLKTKNLMICKAKGTFWSFIRFNKIYVIIIIIVETFHLKQPIFHFFINKRKIVNFSDEI